MCTNYLIIYKLNYTLEKTERATKNGQSRETGNIGYTGRRQTKKKTQLTKLKKMNNTDPTKNLG